MVMHNMDERIDFGTMLRKRRELLGYSIEKVAMATKIRPNLLREFEAADFDRLPPLGYARGIVSSYARYLGLDPVEVLEAYRADLDHFEGRAVDTEAKAHTSAFGRRHNNPPIASGKVAVATGESQFEIPWKLGLIIALIVAVVGFGVWGFLASRGRTNEPPPLPNTPVLPTSTPDAVSDEVTGTVDPGATIDTPAKGQPFTIVVTVPAGVSSWTEITVDGANGYIGTLVGPATKEFEVAQSIQLLIGKPEKVTVTKNGEPVEFAIENNLGVLDLSVEGQ